MAGFFKGIKLVYPDWSDARWLQTAFLFSFVVFALSTPSFTRRPAQLAASAVTGLLVSVAAAWWRSRTLVVPFSGLISSLGIVILCNSHYVWPYAVVAAVSILSRELLRVDGRHVYNPTNFGLTVCLLFLSSWMTTNSSRWGGAPVGMAFLACLGSLVVWRANRWDVSLSYVAGWLIGSVLYARAAGLPLTPVLAPFTGATFMLVTFFMVTDPVTTPSTKTRRLVFGLAVGLMENVFRYYQARNASFYGLFLVTGFVPLFEAWLGRREEQVWKVRELSLGA